MKIKQLQTYVIMKTAQILVYVVGSHKRPYAESYLPDIILLDYSIIHCNC